MPIALSAEQLDLAEHFRGWAEKRAPLELARAAEAAARPTSDARTSDARTSDAWAADPWAGLWPDIVELGLVSIATPGAGGSVLELAIAVEAVATRLTPGPVWSSAVAHTVAGRAGLTGDEAVALALHPGLAVQDGTLRGELTVHDLPGSSWLLAGTENGWFLLPDTALKVVSTSAALDLTRRISRVRVALPIEQARPVPDLSTAEVTRVAGVLAAAEASGLAAWCLETAVSYAKVREQFGRPIGSFQAIKHLCAQMLETTESVAAVAWDAATALAGEADPAQLDFALDLVRTVALEGAVRVAQDCIQVLGGIGFTFEHDAHFYLRRATALRTIIGGSQQGAQGLARATGAGVRRTIRVDLAGRDAAVRAEIRERVARVAARPSSEHRAALAELGYLAPHWPRPYGIEADAVTQVVLDEELAAAGVVRPDLKVASWALPTLLAHGTLAQQERFVGPSLRGELTWCQLFSEPGAGSDLASLRTKAVRVEGGWELTGQKVWTSLAQTAQWGICLARTDPEAAPHRGISYFIVDMSAPGLEIRPLREITGESLFNQVFLDAVFVPDECVVGAVNGGWALARTTLANERVAMATTRLDLSVERAIELMDPDDPDPRVGRVVALSSVGSLLALRTTFRSLAGGAPGAESSVAKLLGVQTRQEASELVVDLLGERALLGECDDDVHQMLTTRCLSIAGGTTQILRNVAAERILGLPRG